MNESRLPILAVVFLLIAGMIFHSTYEPNRQRIRQMHKRMARRDRSMPVLGMAGPELPGEEEKEMGLFEDEGDRPQEAIEAEFTQEETGSIFADESRLARKSVDSELESDALQKTADAEIPVRLGE